jgi:hypothetical protein
MLTRLRFEPDPLNRVRLAVWMLTTASALLAVLVLVPVAAASSSSFDFWISGVGTVPGQNYNQLDTSEAITLTNSQLAVVRTEGSQCEDKWLPTGQIYTLISTTGELSGAFAGASPGAVISFIPDAPGFCPWENFSSPKLRIEYSENSEPRTVTATVVEGSPTPLSAISSTTVTPSKPVVDEPVTMTAIVETSTGTPSGTVSFGASTEGWLSGCQERPVVKIGSIFEATCSAVPRPILTGRQDPHEPQPYEASFSPGAGESYTGSKEGWGYVTTAAETTTTVSVSDPLSTVGAGVTYTAHVTPLYTGPAMPAGFVEFFDGEEPVSSCKSQSLSIVANSGFATASCQLVYSESGEHHITATYLGEKYFLASSTASPQVVIVQPGVELAPMESKPGSTGESGVKSAPLISMPDMYGPSVGRQSKSVCFAGSYVVVHDYRTALIELHCTGTQRAAGTVRLTFRRKVYRNHTKGMDVPLGSVPFSIQPDRTVTVSVPLTSRALAILIMHKRQIADLTLQGNHGLLASSREVELVELARKNVH